LALETRFRHLREVYIGWRRRNRERRVYLCGLTGAMLVQFPFKS